MIWVSLHLFRKTLCCMIAGGMSLSCVSTVANADDSQAAVRSIQSRMVKIFGAGGLRNLYSYSTGFLASPDGHIVTVWSHVLDQDRVTVILANGRKETAVVLGAEPQLDLAVLKIEREGLQLPYFDIENHTSAAPGTRVLAFSNMFKVATGDEPLSILHGVIAAKTKLTARRGAYEVPYDGPVYIIDAITNNPGAGGGLVTNTRGELLAMIGKELRNNESNTWINYAMPMSELTPVIKQIMTGDYVSQETKPDGEDNPLRYQPLDFGLLMIADVVFRTPAFIEVVDADSLAEKLKLKPGDLILFVNDNLVQSCRELRQEFGRLEAGDDLSLTIRRDNKLMTVDALVPRKVDED
ncbi:S1C family serine protease [Planctomycetaceae bacterium]|jgi:serine protease Do|nr:S1C family serine protease [Planctomycetaceae bacterium]MDC0261809.1 S1C family serine protease [Planctomycetaceae bacterium]MDG2389818.1 trypsin-like peptidase domain-containing protein [Planctomycetaceae bacterium]